MHSWQNIEVGAKHALGTRHRRQCKQELRTWQGRKCKTCTTGHNISAIESQCKTIAHGWTSKHNKAGHNKHSAHDIEVNVEHAPEIEHQCNETQCKTTAHGRTLKHSKAGHNMHSGQDIICTQGSATEQIAWKKPLHCKPQGNEK